MLRSGLQIEETWRHANMLDDALEKQIPYSFSPRFGYLTACPSNVGTGLRVSVMTHLPTLVQTKQIDKVYKAASKVGLVLRGLFGEGTRASGDFYQISNQVTLGYSEEEILKTMADYVPQIIKFERNVRETLITENRIGLEDRVWRALGMLERARVLESNDTRLKRSIAAALQRSTPFPRVPPEATCLVGRPIRTTFRNPAD